MMHLIEYYIEAKSWNASTQQYESPLKATEAIKPDAEVNSTNSDYTTSDYNRGCEEQYYISAYAKTNGRKTGQKHSQIICSVPIRRTI